MGVINQRKENIGKIMQNTKMNEHKKKFGKKVTLTHAHRWKDDKQISQRVVMTKEQRKLKGLKRMNKWNKLCLTDKLQINGTCVKKLT
jgi:hypothetical protein